MSNVTGLWIRGEYISGAPETEGLDNVYLTSAAVPIPGAFWLLGSGLLGLAGLKRKFKR
jgi:hypothetical protein